MSTSKGNRRANTNAVRGQNWKPFEIEKLLEFISNNQILIKLRPDQKLLISQEFVDVKQKIQFIEGNTLIINGHNNQFSGIYCNNIVN